MTETNLALQANNISVTYHSRTGLFKSFKFQALNNVSFKVKRGETFGVMGRNGCGKSSLLRVLAGVYQADAGELVTHDIATRTLLTLGLGFDATLSGADNAILSMMLQGFSREEAKAYLPAVRNFSELGDFFERPVKTYSSGMRSRLGFSTGITTQTDLLLIDETLAVGDKTFNAKAEKAMMERIDSDQTVIFVSHSGAQVQKICQRAICLERGKLVAEGDVKDVAQEYANINDKKLD
ncbi:ABC transporter ATP-binding protein [Reinekea blandensis]|uniref:Predicted ABC-type polysaccharide/polyol phosphate export system, ATP-binding protein n=1 Tax=Reinekea blandensis MED297 TaxID=314283 RepID=A4BIX6_9GAMM|nr:ATP-binding cassette domain-containing protein [Reinekea blandensis]EAR07909.1 predicted ABC-type polysaccharide/polyol phosphate export system, ATP-binding protein [Reinekea sp. MED297] [Reinekea blandensis MED297]